MKKLFLTLFGLVAALGLTHGQTITPAHQERAAALVSQMTLDEKIALISGKVDGFSTYAIPRLGIPSIRMADGPQGVRNIGEKNIQSTFFPCGISAAATWNRDAVHEMGAGIGSAAKAHGVQIMLCPGVNIYRSALCGRNFEYYGEDPYLASETAVSFIEGMQKEGVMATIKHFALNQEEYDRHGVSSNADERTMNEIYFPTFRKAVEKAHVGAVMTSYNPVNGTHAAENAALVKDNLRAWGFEGIVMTDWVSTYSTLNFMNSGVDFEMPRAIVTKPEMVKALLENGVVSEAELDEKCQHILQTYAAFGFLDKPLEADPSAEDPTVSRDRAYKLALEGPVMLKNDDGILPLKSGKKNLIAVLGPNANAIVCGGGSGWVNPEDGRASTIVDGMKGLGKNWNVEVLGTPQPDVLRKASAVVLCLGFDSNTEKENSDRKYYLDKKQVALIESVASYTDKIVVVVNSGGEIDIQPWADKVKAIILDWYPGQEGGNALAAILSGKVSPSGRLPFTFWGSLDGNPAQKWYKEMPFMHKDKVRQHYRYTTYGEGVFLGYRGVEHFDSKPLYPFGYGLTYSSFDYSDLQIVPAGDGYDVSFTVRNTGKTDAKEVAQLYVAPEQPSILRPAQELKGYDKQLIAKGQAVRYTLHLGADAFRYYDIASRTWKTAPGRYEIRVGASAGDIKLRGNVTVD